MHILYKLLLLAFLLSGCSGQDATGPVEVRWDRDTCTRCAMAVSDRYSAAQVRGAPAGQATRVYTFDDIGCAVIWLDGQSWKDDARTEIWVAEMHTGNWIDARTAQYVTGKITPMDYGLGAQREALPGSLDFTQAMKHIYAKKSHGHPHVTGHRPVLSGD